MNKKQQLLIFFLVGVMALSVVGTGILLLAGGGNNDTNSADELSQDDLNAQLEQLQAQEQAAAEQCAPLTPSTATVEPLETPEEPFIPEGDVETLTTKDLKVGDGKTVEAGDCIVAHYHGTLASDGSVFDSSYERGEPARFPLTNVIEGWREAVPGMKEGGIRRLVVPSDLGYGEAGAPPDIGSNEDLVFIVEIVRIEEAAQ